MAGDSEDLNKLDPYDPNRSDDDCEEWETCNEKTALRQKLSVKRKFSLLSRNMSASLRKLSNVPEEKNRHFNADIANYAIIHDPSNWCVTTLFQKYLADIQYHHTEAESIMLCYSADHAPVILPRAATELDKRVVWRSRFRRRYAIDVCGRTMQQKLKEYTSLKRATNSYCFNNPPS